MESLRRMMFKKEDPEWRRLIYNWETFIIHSYDSDLMATDNWNPWKEWYDSFKTYTASGAKAPKSFKKKADLWLQLQPMANVTADKLEELTAMRAICKRQREELESLKKDKLALEIKCQTFQGQMAKNMQLFEQQCLELESLKKDKLALKTKCQTFQRQMAKNMQLFEQQCLELESLKKDKMGLEKKCQQLQGQMAMNMQLFEEELETEVTERKSLEQENEALHDEVEKITNKFQKASKKCTELKNEVSSLKHEQKLTQIRDQHNNERKVVQYDPTHNHESQKALSQLGMGHRSLEMSKIKDWAKKLGMITLGNVDDWLCDCEILMKAWCWTPTDLLAILYNCMDSDTYFSWMAKVEMGQTTWPTICRHILETVRCFSKTKVLYQVLTMRDDDSVTRYFRRMWLYYRISNPTKPVSKNDCEYKAKILSGLLPHLSNNNVSCSQDYETLQETVLFNEELWNKSEDQGESWHCKAMRAGVGCPSREKILDRLAKYENPYLRLLNATFWKLVIALSRYEDLGTKEPRFFS